MSEFTFEDIAETLFDFVKKDNIDIVLGAYGQCGDMNEWQGGVIFKTKDNKLIHASGWCDTTGWGCQSGVTFEEIQPSRYEKIKKAKKIPEDGIDKLYYYDVVFNNLPTAQDLKKYCGFMVWGRDKNVSIRAVRA